MESTDAVQQNNGKTAPQAHTSNPTPDEPANAADALVGIISDLHKEKQEKGSWKHYFREKFDSLSKTLAMALLALICSLTAPFVMNLNLSEKFNQQVASLQQSVENEQQALMKEVNSYAVKAQSLGEQMEGDLIEKLSTQFIPANEGNTLSTLESRLQTLEEAQGDARVFEGQLQADISALQAIIANLEASEDPVNWRLHNLLQSLAKEGTELSNDREVSNNQTAWIKRVNYTIQSLPNSSAAGAQLGQIKTEMSAIQQQRGIYSETQSAVDESLILLSTLQGLVKSALL